ncbi:RluA family pseudouridine synthase [Anaerorhabdus sp.]|uniref:RluA family pseudouridine synthase n=1 Tax=Anaerorhabdus sp. TaxID=1872524 RepID=UPI002FCC041F
MKYSINLNELKINYLKEVEGKSLIEFLQLFKISKKNIHLLFSENRIKVNRCLKQREYIINEKDEINIKLPIEEIDYAMDSKCASVIYEDDLVCVVHKDSGIIVHDDDKQKTGTLANQVATYYMEQGYSIPVRYIHRLDEETEGLVLFCKVPLIQPWFDEELAQKRIERTYHAITFNKPRQKEMLISANIGRDRHDAKKMRISSTGKEALTKIKLISSNDLYSLLECKLETGRTHQIRVHLASINCPIVNDSLYGYKSREYNGMGLYAISLTWVDPFTKEKRTVNDSQINYYFK